MAFTSEVQSSQYRPKSESNNNNNDNSSNTNSNHHINTAVNNNNNADHYNNAIANDICRKSKRYNTDDPGASGTSAANIRIGSGTTEQYNGINNFNNNINNKSSVRSNNSNETIVGWQNHFKQFEEGEYYENPQYSDNYCGNGNESIESSDLLYQTIVSFFSNTTTTKTLSDSSPKAAVFYSSNEPDREESASNTRYSSTLFTRVGTFNDAGETYVASSGIYSKPYHSGDSLPDGTEYIDHGERIQLRFYLVSRPEHQPDEYFCVIVFDDGDTGPNGNVIAIGDTVNGAGFEADVFNIHGWRSIDRSGYIPNGYEWSNANCYS